MTFLPVVTRELRVASRKARTFWVRFFAALVATVLFCWIWLTFSQSYNFGRQGSSLFSGLSGLAMTYALLIGLATSDSISEEKREGTLGLLFLTDLRGFDVVLGKLAATSLNSFYGLIAIFPLLAVPLLLGGVNGAEFWRMLLVLCVTLFFSVSTGMFCSALSKSDRRARAAALLLILSFALFIPAAHSIRNRFASGHSDTVLLASPTYAYSLAFDAQYSAESQSFWNCMGIQTVLSLSLLTAASLAVPRLWQDNPASPARVRWKEKWENWTSGNAGVRSLARAEMLGINPFFWLASRPIRKNLYPFAFLGCAAAVWLFLAHKYPREMQEEFIYVITMLSLHTALKWWVASESCRLFSEDRRSGAIELTLSTPLTVSEIVSGQLRALSRQFLVPACVILGADLCMTFAAVWRQSGSADSAWISTCFAGMVVFAADLAAISWTGMWLGIRSLKPGKAAMGVRARILVLPWVLFVGIVSLAGVARIGLSFNPTWQMVLGLWIILSLGVDLLFGTSAARNLQRHFRELATTRFESMSVFSLHRRYRPSSKMQDSV
jgi:ABC-type transport system involved in cytochrome c biogenesis permease component